MTKSYFVAVVLSVLSISFGEVTAQSAGKGLVINEIYIGTGTGTGDQFIELFNPQSTMQSCLRMGPAERMQRESISPQSSMECNTIRRGSRVIFLPPSTPVSPAGHI